MIHWGKVRKDFMPEFLAYVEDLTFMSGLAGSHLFKKSAFPMSEDIIEAEDTIFSANAGKGQQRRHLLILKMALKLTGILRGAIKENLALVPQLTEEEELLYQSILEEAAMDGHVTVIEPMGDTADMFIGERTDTLEMPPPIPDDEQDVIVAELVRGEKTSLAVESTEIEKAGENTCEGNHKRTKDERVRTDGGVKRTLSCKDCGKVLVHREFTFVSKKDAEKCKHEDARWDEGKAGETAHCIECEAPVDPKEYDWNGGGLEEPGDDPSDDEVITLCSEFS